MGEYVPQAPINDDVRKQNQNLPGMGGVFNVVNLHVYHYAGNNPVKYVDPDGRILTPILLIGAQGTAAHNTAYEHVTAVIFSLGYMVHPNLGMRDSYEGNIVSACRPDFQGFVNQNTEVKYWELKQGSKNGLFNAITDISDYIAIARSKGINARAGEALGTIAEMVPVKGMKDVYLNIYSPVDGVIIYDAFKYTPDAPPIKIEVDEKTVMFILGLLAAGIGALSGTPTPILQY
jgi:hypothetical protein